MTTFAPPRGGAPRARQQHKALEDLAALAVIDPRLAEKALGDIERSEASDGFKRRARKIVNARRPS